MSAYTPNKELVDAAHAAAALAKKSGASDVAATVTREREVTTSWRDGKVEKVSDATSRSLSLALYVDGRYSSVSTSDLRPQALERFIADSIALARALAKDPHRKLPDPSSYAGRTEADLELFDPAVAAITADQRIARAKALEEAARSAPGAEKITTVSTETGDATWEMYRVASNGFEGGNRGTNIWSEASVSMKDEDGRRPEDWSSGSTRFLADLPNEGVIGKDATTRALGHLGAKKIGSGTMPIIVEARAAGSLLRHLIGPISGGALQQKESFFDGKLDKPVAAKTFTLTDDPLLKRGLGSKPFDGEGMSTKPRTLIEKGVLKSYLLDVYYASKLGMKPTTGRTTNLVVAPGTKSLAQLQKEMKDGLLVTSFLGGNSNSTTGVFSLGLAGFHIVNGERKEPISEMNLSGKHIDFWSKLVAAGNDPYLYSSTRAPSLVFDGASIAGK
jgi:PmbA protein